MKLDVTLRELVGHGTPALVDMVAGGQVVAALPTEFPVSRDPRVDTLLDLSDERILHIEWQADYLDRMPMRMLGYWHGIADRYPGRRIHQAVIQLGGRRPIADCLDTDCLRFRYQVIDSRQLDPAPLLASPALADNLLAMLFGIGDPTDRIHAILQRIAGLDERTRRDAMIKLLILAGARQAVPIVWEVINSMPITIDTEENPYLVEWGRRLQRHAETIGVARGQRIGEQMGELRGELRGELKGKSRTLIRVLEHRFGPIGAEARARIQAADLATLDLWVDRALTADSLDAALATDPAG